MKRHILAAAAAGFFLAAATGQPPGDAKLPAKGDSAVAKDAEVRFANGSTVFMTILQDRIEIQTEFGKLSVAPRDIRSIDFGVHLPEGMDGRIEDALKQLTSGSYRQREAAVKELAGFGALAYPSLHRAAKSKEAEVASRAQTAIKLIERRVPAKQLRLKEEDVIHTCKFTIVGRVVTTAIKARSEYFGELALKPHQLHAIRWLEGAGEAEVTIDAARYGSAHNQWMDAGILVDPQLDLQITASGMVDLWPQGPGQYMANPSGMVAAGGRPQPVAAGPGGHFVAPPGVLVGRIGEDGTPFVIAERYAGRPTRPGRLYLHIGPSPWNNASTGSYRVRIISGYSAAEGGT
jgi:hypothetical protein